MNPEDLDELERLLVRYQSATPESFAKMLASSELRSALVRLAPQLITCAREYGRHGSIHQQAPYIAGPECEE